MKRVPLPIDPILPEVVATLEKENCLVLQAAPGSGKTTRVPPAILSAAFAGGPGGKGEILVLEPRRLAAKMAARRVAEELGDQVGGVVGYQFRFENVSSARTRLRFLTEGMLMKRLLSDPELRGVAAVVLDEFHERHLHGDTALAFLRKLQLSTRPELRIVVMSATLDAEAVSKFLGTARSIRAEGRQFEVTVEYLGTPPERGLELAVKNAVVRAIEGAEALPLGARDILVFLPGMADIRRSAEALSALARQERLLVLPLHGELDRDEQDRAVSPGDHGMTKVILATNVAETSLTIPGVGTVVDSGLARVSSYSHWSGLPSLKTRPISRASAIQRAGRAGRVAPGRCYRLYSKGDFDGRPYFDVPEIQRADLAQTLLELKALGIRSARTFEWFESPSDRSVDSAESLLYRLGASLKDGAITPLGRRLSEIPAHPRLGRLAIEAARRGLADPGAWLAAFLSEGRIEGMDLLAAFHRQSRQDFAVSRMKDRILSGTRAEKPTGPGASPAGETDDDRLAISVLAGFPDRVARRRSVSGSISRGASRTGAPAEELMFAAGGSASFDASRFSPSEEYFVAVDVEEKKHLNQARAQVQVSVVCPIHAEWLLDLEPPSVVELEELSWNPERKRIESVSRILYDSLVLNESRGDPSNLEAASRLLAETLEVGTLMDPAALQMLGARIRLLSEHYPQLGLRTLDEKEIRENVLEFCRGKISQKEVEEADFGRFLEERLTSEQRDRLERFTPAFVSLSRGRRVKVNYEEGKPPWIESRLQDFFGMSQGPVILGGRVPLTLHLLAPNHRAVQVTSDLAGFWARDYARVRKELSRRYPRHSWPENPLHG